MTTLRFKFDKRIPAEAALMERLRELPEDRHMEYMRNLAVKAFLQECAESPQATRDLTRSVSQQPRDNPSTSPTLSAPEREPEPIKPAPLTQPSQAPSDVSLASLKHIVG